MRSIASAPDVAPESLFDVPAATAREALELVFRIDEEFGLKPKEVGGELVLAIDPLSKKVPKLAQALKAWLARIDSEKSGEITSGIGHIGQKRAALRLKVRPRPGISACVPRESSQPTKAASSLAATSLECVALAPHDRQRHLWAPDGALPFRFMGPPQDGHFILSTASSRNR